MNNVSFPGLGLEFTISADFITIGDFAIKWYGVLIALGVGAALAFAYIKAPKFGVDRDKFFDAVIYSVFSAIIFARVYYVIFSWSNYADDPLSALYIWDGGLAIYGAVIGGIGLGVFLARRYKMNIAATLDIAGMAFLIGQAIGRWGNFTNQEAFGGNTTLPWGMTSESVVRYLEKVDSDLISAGIPIDADLPVHPCFLYESLWCILGFVFLYFHIKKRKFDGELFLMYLAWYGAGRAVIEGLRIDSLMIGSLRISQVLAILTVIISIALIIRKRSIINRANDPSKFPLYVDSEMWVQEQQDIEKKKFLAKMKKEGKFVADEDEAFGDEDETDEEFYDDDEDYDEEDIEDGE